MKSQNLSITLNQTLWTKMRSKCRNMRSNDKKVKEYSLSAKIRKNENGGNQDEET